MGTQEPQKENDLGIIFNNSEKKSGDNAEHSPKHDTASSHLSNHGDVFDVTKAFKNSHGEAGTIVSDRKRSRPSLGESFSSAFKEWWGKTERNISRSKELVKKISEEPPTVAKAETRAEVVREAVQEEHLAPKDDHRVVIEKVRTFRTDSARVTGVPAVTIKEPEQVQTKGAWSHTVDEKPQRETQEQMAHKTTLVPDVRTATIAPIVEKRIKGAIQDFVKSDKQPQRVVKSDVVRSIRNEQIGYMHIPDMVEKREEEKPKATVRIAPTIVSQSTVPRSEEFTEKRKIITPLHTTPPQQEIPTPPEVPEQTAQAPEVRTPPEEKAYIPSEDVVREHTDLTFHSAPREEFEERVRQVNLQNEETVVRNTLPARSRYTLATWAIFGGIGVVGATLAVILSIYLNVFDRTPPDSGIVVVSTFFDTDSENPLPLDATPEIFLTTVSERVTTTQGKTVHFYPTIGDENVSRPATAQEFFSFLNTHLSDSAIREFEDSFMLGSIASETNRPFLVLRSYDFDALFMAFLSWEGYMYTDLAPLFGTAHITKQVFIDTILGNRSVRVLYDDSGRETLVYSFVNQNTIVITSSLEALSKILERI